VVRERHTQSKDLRLFPATLPARKYHVVPHLTAKITTMPKLILLPGMDGTGKLFEPLTNQFDSTSDIEVVEYPADQSLSYPDLINLVRSAIPQSEPFVLLAESFSSPLAVMCAASGPSNLKGLILCAGFVSSTVYGWRQSIYSRLASLILKRTPPDIVIRSFLVGPNASTALLAAIRSAISSVDSKVLAHRLRTILTCDARAYLAKVQVPMLYLQATQDRLVGPSCLEEIRHIKPQMTVEQIGGPHLLLQQEPEKSAAAIKAWLHTIAGTPVSLKGTAAAVP
jgi:pimeloyl-ACP methyl ester carboxylesterase